MGHPSNSVVFASNQWCCLWTTTLALDSRESQQIKASMTLGNGDFRILDDVQEFLCCGMP